MALASLTGSKSQSSKSQSARGNPLTSTKERPPVSDENEPPLGQLSTHGGDKVSTKKKKRSSGTASKRAGGGKPLPSSRSLPPSQRSFATDETEPLNSSRLLSSSRSLAVIDELAAEAELAEAELAEDELSRSEAQLQSRDEALLKQLEAIRVRRSVPDSWIMLTIREGRNRQVRRMTAAVGHPTLRLVRRAIGEWTMDGLAPGVWREVEG
jgi:hypothetical protein